MKNKDSVTIIFAVLLITLGVLFLLPSVIPGFSVNFSWPIIFFILALGFYLPSLMWPAVRRELAALYIPGSVMLSLRVIFLYNVTTNDWAAWAYAWLLIVAGVGLGLILSSVIGRWSRSVIWVGIWMLSINLAIFSLFAMIFGGPLFKVAGPVLMVVQVHYC